MAVSEQERLFKVISLKLRNPSNSHWISKKMIFQRIKISSPVNSGSAGRMRAVAI
jgi:hypothetical protein